MTVAGRLVAIITNPPFASLDGKYYFADMAFQRVRFIHSNCPPNKVVAGGFEPPSAGLIIWNKQFFFQ